MTQRARTRQRPNSAAIPPIPFDTIHPGDHRGKPESGGATRTGHDQLTSTDTRPESMLSYGSADQPASASGRRKLDGHCEAAFLAWPCGDRAVVGLDDCSDDGQTQAAAAVGPQPVG